MARNVNLVERTFKGLRHAVVDATSTVVDVLTDQERADLLKKNGTPPARIADDWYANRVVLFSYSPDYGNGTAGLLAEGEFVEEANDFVIGCAVREQPGKERVRKVRIPRADVNVNKVGGLTLTKRRASAWDDDYTGIVSINNNVMVKSR